MTRLLFLYTKKLAAGFSSFQGLLPPLSCPDKLLAHSLGWQVAMDFRQGIIGRRLIIISAIMSIN
jgi:hypothetical protein